MSDDDAFAKVTRKMRDNLARLTLWKTQDMMRKMRRHRAACRTRDGTTRLSKEFRVLKSLLLAHQQLIETRQDPALTGSARRPTRRR